MFKKIAACFAILCFLFTCGCSKESKLLPYISELRETLYEGSSERYTVTAGYGFCETPRQSDGKVGELKKRLTVSLKGADADVKITGAVAVGDVVCKESFKLNPVTFMLTAEFPMDAPPSQVNLTLSENGNDEEVILLPAVPEGSFGYKQTLKYLEANQPGLIENYESNGAFAGEIALRILVRNEKPYWYVGLTDQHGKTKALLIDGTDGNVLAVKDIF